MKVLVCGGRDYSDADKVYTYLSGLPTIDLLIHGAARGADLIAEDWAKTNQVNYVGIPAKWKRYKNSAGPIRNKEMLNFKPDLVIAFPGGKGTADMVSKADNAGISVVEVEDGSD